MILNGIDKIDNDGGDYLVLCDYGMEGLSVRVQAKTLEDVIHWIAGGRAGEPTAIVKLVRIEAREVPDGPA